MRVCKSLPSDLGCGADTGICMQTGSSEKHPLALTTTQTAEMWGEIIYWCIDMYLYVFFDRPM